MNFDYDYAKLMLLTVKTFDHFCLDAQPEIQFLKRV